MCMMQNYHRHSYYSNLMLTDSVTSNEQYAQRAVELGQDILSSCEHGTPGAYRECAELAEKYNLKWRYVAEAYFVRDRHEKDNTNAHLIVAAKTKKGIGDINFALSEANLSGFYYRPRLDLDLLLTLDPCDVFVTTACCAGIWKYGKEEAERLLQILHAHFGDSLMLEVQYHDTDKQREINSLILSLYRKYGIRLICGLDSHYIYPEDAELRDQRLKANNITYEDEQGWYLDYPSADETYKRFEKQRVLSGAQIMEALSNTNVFLDFEDVRFDRSKKLPTLYPYLTQEERNQRYRDLVYNQWAEYKFSVPPERWDEYERAIAYEVDTITSTNTSDYFLLDYEIVKRAKEKGGLLTPTGRGSGPSYLTNMLLGFTQIDRMSIPLQLFPDRFISKDRLASGSLPDLDLNCGEVEPFVKAQEEVMGQWHSAPMVAYGKLKTASAWKMFCRAANVPFETANKISDMLKRYELDLKYADEDEKDSIQVSDYVPKEYHELLKASEKYQGIVDSVSPHPCAHLLCQNDIRRETGIFRLSSKTGKNKVVYAAFIDGATADAYGYLKNDLLKVDIVKINAQIYKRIGIPQPDISELLTLTAHDKDAWSMYSKGLTMGLNQVEKDKSREKVMRYKPANISELSAFVAAIRPAFQSMLKPFLNRNHFDYGIPALDNLLQTPQMRNSYILYQEQIMAVLQYGGFPASESYAAIKAIAKKHPEKVLPLKEKFLSGFTAKLLSEGEDSEVARTTSEKVWEIISDACGYGFNSCVVGSTRIKMNSYEPTVEELYRDTLNKNNICYDYGTALSVCRDGYIRDNKIVDIRYQGKRDVYKLETSSGKSVVCTANHKFPVHPTMKMVKLENLHIGDVLYVMGSNVALPEAIALITPCGTEDVYDVEMEAPNHNFVLDNGLVVGNSHSVSVALDSLYTAYAKAHWPLETYAALLSNYIEKGDKDKIDKARAEMKQGFGIRMVPCKFRQDNRGFYIDHEHNTISDSLVSVKHLSKAVAGALYAMRANSYNTFTDLLYDMTCNHKEFDTRNIEILIRMGYFEEFGSSGKLLHVFQEFTDGDNKFSKAHVKATQEKRLSALREIERDTPESDIPLPETMRFEIEHYGTPITVCESARGIYAVTDVNTTYSPKVYLYNISKGTNGVMKILKPAYNKAPLHVGDVIRIKRWEKKPAYRYEDGRAVLKDGAYDLWLREYEGV